MKFTLGWLKDHLDTQASLGVITEKLTALGLEVDAVEDRAAFFSSFRVAYVESAVQHPDADRLRVCIVDTGAEKLQVVCGAPNARAGMKAVFAPAGSVIPATGDTLKKGVIRGQESNGMLVSEREMGLSEEHNGIIEVAADVAVGTPFAELYGLDDPVIDVNLTPNRADCAGVRGIARDLAAAGLGALRPLDLAAVPAANDARLAVRLDLLETAATACPHFVGRRITGVRNGPSPDWLQRRLKAVGLRPISALVDITNYLSFDLCRPLHIFDAAKLQGDLEVRLAREGESLVALDGKTYTLAAGMTVLADAAGVQGLAGIMGGAQTGCTAETTDIFLECAWFDPARTARTGRALQINSDARYRFERGVDPALTAPAAEIATRMILDLCGGAAGPVVAVGAPPDQHRVIAYAPDYFTKLAGFTLPATEQARILRAVGCVVEGQNDWSVTPPSWRADIEGRADLVEEIARVHGYDALPALPLLKTLPVTASAETLPMARARKIRGALAVRGLEECVTWSFLPHQRAALFAGRSNEDSFLQIVNPISADLDQMRPSLLPNLIDAAMRNAARGFGDVALFEVGPVFRTARPDGQSLHAAGLRAERIAARHWTGAGASRVADAFDAKADALAALEVCGLGVSAVQIGRDAAAWYHPGRSGTLKLGQIVIGMFGALHPALLDNLDVKSSLCGFEIFVDRIPAAKAKGGTHKKLLALSALQPVERDFAFVVAQDVEADSLVRAARGVDKTLIARIDVFDVYAGAGIEPGYKSVALNVVIQPVDKTLTDVEIDSFAAKIVSAVATKTQARLRS